MRMTGRWVAGCRAGCCTNAQALALLREFGAYGSPPCSGNVFHRDFLARVLPLDESPWQAGADAVPILLSAGLRRGALLPRRWALPQLPGGRLAAFGPPRRAVRNLPSRPAEQAGAGRRAGPNL